MREEFRAKVAAALGLEDPRASDEAIATAIKELRTRSRIAAALGVAADASDEAMADAARGLVEASKRRVREVKLQPADRKAIDATVAASGDPFADLRERQVLDAVGLPVAQVPPPVVIQKGVPVEERTQKQHEDVMLRRLGPRFFPGTEKPPATDTVYYPSPNDVVEFKDGQWIEKQPYREI
jgi:hypothetical protein